MSQICRRSWLTQVLDRQHLHLEYLWSRSDNFSRSGCRSRSRIPIHQHELDVFVLCSSLMIFPSFSNPCFSYCNGQTLPCQPVRTFLPVTNRSVRQSRDPAAAWLGKNLRISLSRHLSRKIRLFYTGGFAIIMVHKAWTKIQAAFGKGAL